MQRNCGTRRCAWRRNGPTGCSSAWARSTSVGGYVQAEFEQFPRPENRIELDQRTDALGVGRTRLYWKKADSERRTAGTIMTRLLGEALIKKDIGRMRMRNYLTDGTEWPATDQGGGWHHMGGTRMSDSAATGVVPRQELQGLRHGQPLRRRIVRVRHRWPCEPYIQHCQAGAAAGRSP